MIGLLLQARMNSRRLPGKVMYDIDGRPMIQYVVEQCRKAFNRGPVIVCTSIESTDDPIYEFCIEQGIDVYRGPLDDVYARFVGCIEKYGLDVFGRVCCDSPCISPEIIKFAVDTFNEVSDADLVTNVFRRTFPVGQSVEIVKSESYLSEVFQQSSGFSAEHVTQSFYKTPELFNLYNIENKRPGAKVSWAIDEASDLERIEKNLKNGFLFNEADIVVKQVSSYID